MLGFFAYSMHYMIQHFMIPGHANFHRKKDNPDLLQITVQLANCRLDNPVAAVKIDNHQLLKPGKLQRFGIYLCKSSF